MTMTGLSPNMEFISQVLSANSIERVWTLHVDKMTSYGFDRMLYGANRFRTHGEFGDLTDAVILTNHHKDYIDLFFGKSLYFHAPMAIWAANNVGVCSWQWAVDRRARGESTEGQDKILDLNERMGVIAGYSISFDTISERSKSAIGLCAREGLTQADVEDIWAQHGAEIVLLNNLVNQKISTLPFARQGKPLTDRQREVLQWVADGKTLQDIATIMGLNQATVEKHLRLARGNLNADTTAQAILKASMQNQFFIFEGLRTGKARQNLAI
jgi:LuxR family transcriptional regulator, quorum-sensing system regulator SdiA